MTCAVTILSSNLGIRSSMWSVQIMFGGSCTAAWRYRSGLWRDIKKQATLFPVISMASRRCR